MNRRPTSHRSSTRILLLFSVSGEALAKSLQIQATQEQQKLQDFGGASSGFVDPCEIPPFFHSPQEF